MSKYIDGFVIPIPKGKIDTYRAMAEKAGKVWKDHGALEYIECVGDDLDVKHGTSFLKMASANPDETVVFAWIVYNSRADRDEINKKVMEDPRMKEMCSETNAPFDSKRMSYGGFKSIVEA